MSSGGLTSLPVVLVVAGRLYATLILAERRSGQVVMLVMRLLAPGPPVVHLTGWRWITARGSSSRSGPPPPDDR
jgi:hypothetical protein